MRAFMILAALVVVAQSAFAADLKGIPDVQLKAYEAFVASHSTKKPVLFEAIGPMAEGSTEFYGTFEHTRKKTIKNCGTPQKAHETYSILMDSKGVITESHVGYMDIFDCD